jgi:simple sugar transport system ATP-binding protein
LPLDPDSVAGDLPVSTQQRVEIVKALSREARILILDEPTAVLAPAEIAELLRRLRSFADAGRAVVLITHKLREALSIADEVTVLRHGANVLSVPSSETSEPLLVGAILGTSALPGGGEDRLEVLAGATVDDRLGATPDSASALITERPQRSGTKVVVDGGLTAERSASREPAISARVILEARRIGLVDQRGVMKIRDASFAIHEGEIVGIAAVEGAGHHELLRALAGRLEPTTGTLIRPGSIGFIPEDRHGEALILDFSLTENVALRGAGTRRGAADWHGTESHTRALLDAFDVRAHSARVAASTLSGGNQQKLVLARELDGSPAVLVAENPTRGLDIHSSAMVHARLRAAAAAGTAIVVHSSDLDELLALASRILVVFAGRVHQVPHDRDAVGRGMLGLFSTTPQ